MKRITPVLAAMVAVSNAPLSLCAEHFVAIEPSAQISPQKKLQVLKYDFESGRKSDPGAPTRRGRAGGSRILLTPDGRQFLLENILGGGPEDARATASWPDSPASGFLKYGSRNISLASLSPDGRNLVTWDFAKNQIVLMSRGAFRSVPLTWRLSHPFSWNRQSTQVAFYFAESDEADDGKIQEHGVALLNLDGVVKTVRDAGMVSATPHTNAKDIPMGWSPSGDRVYFSEGQPDPKVDGGAARRARPRQIVTVELNLLTGVSRVVMKGTFSDIAPSGAYILTTGYVAQRDPTRACWKADLASDQVKLIAKESAFPRISPSGKQAAVIYKGGEVLCLRTDTWEPIGKPVASGEELISIDEWISNFHWIVQSSSTEPAAQVP